MSEILTPTARQIGQRNMSTNASSTASNERTERILVIDDNDPNVVLTRRMLKSGGYLTVRSATDSRAGLAMARTWHPDLVLLDLHMPRLGGTDFLKSLKGGGDPRPVPVLVLTADIDPEAHARAIRAGASECMVKPIDVGELLQKVGELLAG